MADIVRAHLDVERRKAQESESPKKRGGGDEQRGGSAARKEREKLEELKRRYSDLREANKKKSEIIEERNY